MLVIEQCYRTAKGTVHTSCLCKWTERVMCVRYCLAFRRVNCCFFFIKRITDFVNHSSDYRPNRTPLGPVTIINTAVRIFHVAVRLSVVDYRLRKHEVRTKKGL